MNNSQQMPGLEQQDYQSRIFFQKALEEDSDEVLLNLLHISKGLVSIHRQQ